MLTTESEIREYVDTSLRNRSLSHLRQLNADVAWRFAIAAADYETADIDGLWRFRDEMRFKNNVWKDSLLLSILYDNKVSIPSFLLAHQSIDDPTLVAFTPSEDMGRMDRQRRMKIGKFVRAYGKSYETGSDPSNAQIEQISYAWREALQDPVFVVGMKLADFRFCYWQAKKRPSSCMSKPISDFESYPHHPTDVYAFGDVGIAYLKQGETVLARALINPKTCTYSRVYGIEGRGRDDLESKLHVAGYRKDQDCLLGCKLAKLENENGDIVAPFIDFVPRIEEHDDYLLVSDNGDLIAENHCSGLLYKDDRRVCDDCGDRVGENQIHYSTHMDRHICESCLNDYVFTRTGRWGSDWASLDECIETEDGEYILADVAENLGYVEVTDQDGNEIWVDSSVTETVEDENGDRILKDFACVTPSGEYFYRGRA